MAEKWHVLGLDALSSHKKSKSCTNCVNLIEISRKELGLPEINGEKVILYCIATEQVLKGIWAEYCPDYKEKTK